MLTNNGSTLVLARSGKVLRWACRSSMIRPET